MQTNIKVDINIAITVTVTILLLFQNQQTQETKQVVEDVKDKAEKTDIKFNKTFEILNSTTLSDKQILQIVKKILTEVD